MMSSSIPILIQPPYYNNEYYLDGGIFSNCPVNECFNEQKCDKNEIFAIINDKRFPIDENNKFHNNSNNDSNDDSNNLNENTNLFNFFVIILKTIFRKLMIIENENLIEINNNINVCLTKNNLDISYWKYVLTNKDERVYLLELGKSITLKLQKSFRSRFLRFISSEKITIGKFNSVFIKLLLVSFIQYSKSSNV